MKLQKLALISSFFLFFSVVACSSMPKHNGYPYSPRGAASWYGNDFQGRKTASGEAFDMHKLTAAHPSLPFGTLVRVESLTTKKFVTVRINDRGPASQNGRIIDLSFEAARQLGMVSKGEDQVRLSVVGEN